jgi:hypothetical protein
MQQRKPKLYATNMHPEIVCFMATRQTLVYIYRPQNRQSVSLQHGTPQQHRCPETRSNSTNNFWWSQPQPQPNSRELMPALRSNPTRHLATASVDPASSTPVALLQPNDEALHPWPPHPHPAHPCTRLANFKQWGVIKVCGHTRQQGFLALATFNRVTKPPDV